MDKITVVVGIPVYPGKITCSIPGAALSKQVIPSRNIADDFHAQGQVDSEQNGKAEIVFRISSSIVSQP